MDNSSLSLMEMSELHAPPQYVHGPNWRVFPVGGPEVPLFGSSHGEIDAELEGVFQMRIAKLESNKKRRRKRSLSSSSSASSSQQQDQVSAPPSSSYETTSTTSSRNNKSRPEGVLTYPLPTLADEYIMKIQHLLGDIVDSSRWRTGHYTNIDRAMVHLSSARGDWQRVQDIIAKMSEPPAAGRRIPKILESELEDLWHNANYHLHLRTSIAQRENLHSVDQLGPVRKYRIRQKRPCPTEEGQKKKYKMPLKAKLYMNELFLSCAYPSQKMKSDIHVAYGISVNQISNYFKNKRQRNKEISKQSDLSHSPEETPLASANIDQSDLKQHQEPPSEATECPVTQDKYKTLVVADFDGSSTIPVVQKDDDIVINTKDDFIITNNNNNNNINGSCISSQDFEWTQDHYCCQYYQCYGYQETTASTGYKDNYNNCSFENLTFIN